MNQTQMMPVLSNEVPQDTAPVCHIVPLTRFSDAHRELPFCAVPAQDSMEQLTRAFRAAPQFSQIPLEKLLERKGSRSFRMILLGENTYYLRQAAAYLTALSLKTRKETPSDNADFYWNDLDLSAFGLEVKKTSAEAPKSTLLAISSMLLDPAINLSNAPVSQPGVMAQMMREQESLELTELKSSGILIAALGTLVILLTVERRDRYRTANPDSFSGRN